MCGVCGGERETGDKTVDTRRVSNCKLTDSTGEGFAGMQTAQFPALLARAWHVSVYST